MRVMLLTSPSIFSRQPSKPKVSVDLVDILCCPTCKGDLSLKVDSEEKGEIISGSFTCQTCKVSYPIEDGIPDLLPRK